MLLLLIISRLDSENSHNISALLDEPCKTAKTLSSFKSKSPRSAIYKNNNFSLLFDSDGLTLKSRGFNLRATDYCYYDGKKIPEYFCSQTWFSPFVSPKLAYIIFKGHTAPYFKKVSFACFFDQTSQQFIKISSNNVAFLETDVLMARCLGNTILDGFYKPSGFFFWVIFKKAGDLYIPAGYYAKMPFKNSLSGTVLFD
ncbi:MAG: hypothetical protein NZT61_01230 [Deltaproteobacteria bacterium]|nr:hypothetical protein [Deltaproteobacteria bacterium]